MNQSAASIEETKKVRELLRTASKQKPHLVVLLKHSLSKNNSNLMSFVAHMGQYSALRQKDECIKAVELQTQAPMLTTAPQSQNLFLRNKSNKRSQIQSIKQPRNHSHTHRQPPSIYRNSIQRQNHGPVKTQSNHWSPTKPNKHSLKRLKNKTTPAQHPLVWQQKQKVQTFSAMEKPTKSHDRLSQTLEFWKRRRRWGLNGKEQGGREQGQRSDRKEAPGTNSLSELVSFDVQTHQKTQNFFVLQLQINLACSRANRLKINPK